MKNSNSVIKLMTAHYLHILDLINNELKDMIHEHLRKDDMQKVKEILSMIDTNSKFKKSIYDHIEKLSATISDSKNISLQQQRILMNKEHKSWKDILDILRILKENDEMNTFQLKDYFFSLRDFDNDKSKLDFTERNLTLLTIFYTNFFLMITNALIERKVLKPFKWIITEKGKNFLKAKSEVSIEWEDLPEYKIKDYSKIINDEDNNYLMPIYDNLFRELKRNPLIQNLTMDNYFLFSEFYISGGELLKDLDRISDGDTILVNPFFYDEQRSIYVENIFSQYSLLEGVDETGLKVYYQLIKI